MTLKYGISYIFPRPIKQMNPLNSHNLSNSATKELYVFESAKGWAHRFARRACPPATAPGPFVCLPRDPSVPWTEFCRFESDGRCGTFASVFSENKSERERYRNGGGARVQLKRRFECGSFCGHQDCY